MCVCLRKLLTFLRWGHSQSVTNSQSQAQLCFLKPILEVFELTICWFDLTACQDRGESPQGLCSVCLVSFYRERGPWGGPWVREEKEAEGGDGEAGERRLPGKSIHLSVAIAQHPLPHRTSGTAVWCPPLSSRTHSLPALSSHSLERCGRVDESGVLASKSSHLSACGGRGEHMSGREFNKQQPGHRQVHSRLCGPGEPPSGGGAGPAALLPFHRRKH